MALTREQAVVEQRKLAKLANFADNFVRVPFTTVGVGADSASGVVPGVGDALGFIIFLYVFAKARHLGLPKEKVGILVAYAVADGLIGFVPIAGDLADIFMRPSRMALKMVTKHLREEHLITDEVHINKPMLDEFLDNRASSKFWSAPAVKWFVLHLPDLVVLAFIIIFINAIVQLITTISGWVTHFFG